MTDNQFARFVTKIDQRADGCWWWTAGRASNGYAKFKINGRTVGAHRVAYEHFIGLIPKDKEIDHTCRNRSCVNARHLEAVTHRVNVQRGLVPLVMPLLKKGNQNCLGMVHSESTKAKMSAARLGTRMSAESRAKLSASRTGVSHGRHSDETKAKMAAARRAYWAKKRGEAA